MRVADTATTAMNGTFTGSAAPFDARWSSWIFSAA